MITGVIVAVLLTAWLILTVTGTRRAWQNLRVLLRCWRQARRGTLSEAYATIPRDDGTVTWDKPPAPGTHGPLIKTVRVYLDGYTRIETRGGVRTVPGRCPECQTASVDDELRRLTS